MVGTKKPLRVVRTWYTSTHGTGEGPHLETEDGRTWRDSRPEELDGSLTWSGEIRTNRGGYLW